MEPDTVTLHPGETGRYDHGDDGMCAWRERERTKKRQGKEGEKQHIYLLFTDNKV